MKKPRVSGWALLLALSCITAAGPRALAQQDASNREPLTKGEFAIFLEEYRAFKAEHVRAVAENAELKTELATVKTELSALKEQRWDARAESSFALERQALLQEVRSEIRDATEPLLPGFNNFALGGFATLNYRDRQNDDSTFGGMIAPILLWKPNDRLFFESELHIALGETETHVDLGYAHFSYLLNDYVTLGAGKFILPFGTFQERLHPSWINKLPSAPLMTGLMGESGLGVQIRGGAPIGPTKINYAAYYVNGPRFEDTQTRAGSLDFSRNTDNNNSKAFGGRFGFLPIPELEIGASLLRGRVGNSGSVHNKVDTLALGADFAYARQFEAIKGRLDLRGEFTWIDTDDVIFTGPFNPFTFDNKRHGWYVQAAYRPTLMEVKLGDQIELKNFEFVVRYDRLRMPGPTVPGADRDQFSLGLDYWIKPNVVLKTAYVFDDAHGDRDQDGFFAQVGIGF
jgi:hypothetical protein